MSMQRSFCKNKLALRFRCSLSDNRDGFWGTVFEYGMAAQLVAFGKASEPLTFGLEHGPKLFCCCLCGENKCDATLDVHNLPQSTEYTC